MTFAEKGQEEISPLNNFKEIVFWGPKRTNICAVNNPSRKKRKD